MPHVRRTGEEAASTNAAQVDGQPHTLETMAPECSPAAQFLLKLNPAMSGLMLTWALGASFSLREASDEIRMRLS